jgi:hypothetical protein
VSRPITADNAVLLQALHNIVKARNPGLPSPNYMESGTYSPQWHQHGALSWYRMPTGEVLAMRGPLGLIVSPNDLSPMLDVLK